MADVLRWGRSAYETASDLALERAGAEALGLTWSAAPTSAHPPGLDSARVLVVTSKVQVDRDVLRRFGGDLVLTTTSGFDHIDLVSARARGVAVARCPLARRDPVVAWCLAALVDLLREGPWLDDAARSGRWARAELPERAPRGVAGASVAIVGLGVIGCRMATVLEVLGARVLGVDPRGVPAGIERVDLEEALDRADAMTLHCSLGEGSRGLLDAAAIGRLRSGAVLVNSARGDLLDVDAAVAAVVAGRLRGLAVDVFPEEPWPRLAEGARHQGVRFGPHGAGYTQGLGARVADEVIATLRAWREGGPLPHAVLG